MNQPFAGRQRAEFGPNTTTFVYPAEIFPVRVRTTSHGIAAASGKLGAFAGTYALTALLPVIGFARTSAIVAGVCVLGLLVTVALLPEPKGLSLEELTEPGSGPPARAFHPPTPSAPPNRPFPSSWAENPLIGGVLAHNVR